MAILGTVLGGLTLLNQGADAINKGTCGNRCYGFGKSLRKCRDRRDADCKRAEQQRKELEEKKRREEAERLAMLQKPAPASAISNPVANLGSSTIILVLVAIFMAFNFFMNK